MASFAAAPSIRHIHVDLNSRALVPRSDPRLASSDRARALFGDRDSVVVGVTTTRDVLSDESVSLIDRLSTAVARTEGIDPDSVRSLATMTVVWGDGDGIHVGQLGPRAAAEHRVDAHVVEQIDRLGLADGLLLSPARDATIIVGNADDGADRYRLLRDLERLAASPTGRGTHIWLTGTALAQAALGRAAALDVLRLVPIVLVVLVLLLTLAFRSVPLALVAVTEVGISLLWTVIAITWSGSSVVVTMIVLPVLLIVVGVSDDIYVIRRYLRDAAASPHLPRERLLTDSISSGARPIILTTLSTAGGLLTLATTNLRPLQLFGIYGALAVATSGLMVFTVVPALLATIAAPRPPRASERRWTAPVPTFRAAAATAAAAILVAGVALTAAQKVFVDDSWIRNLPAASSVARGDRALNDRLGGTTSVDFVVRLRDGVGFDGRDGLRRLLLIQEAFAKGPHVGAVTSVATDVLRILAALTGRPYRDVVASLRVGPGGTEPIGDAEIQQCLLGMASADPRRLSAALDADYRQAHLTVYVRNGDYQRVAAVLETARRLERDPASGVLQLQPFGDGWISYFTVSALVGDQARSIGLALLLDGLLLSVFFRSLRTGVIGMLPAAMTVALAFGAIGVAALPLGIANAMFASIVIGVGMDFPVHVLATYERACAGGLRCGAALHGTLEEAGLSVTTSAIALALAFLVLLASSTAPTMQLGLVVAFGLATTGVLTLVLLPAALVLWNGRSKPEEDLKTAAT